MTEIRESHRLARPDEHFGGLRFYHWPTEGEQQCIAFAVFVRDGFLMKYSMHIESRDGPNDAEKDKMRGFIKSKGYSV